MLARPCYFSTRHAMQQKEDDGSMHYVDHARESSRKALRKTATRIDGLPGEHKRKPRPANLIRHTSRKTSPGERPGQSQNFPGKSHPANLPRQTSSWHTPADTRRNPWMPKRGTTGLPWRYGFPDVSCDVFALLSRAHHQLGPEEPVPSDEPLRPLERPL